MIISFKRKIIILGFGFGLIASGLFLYNFRFHLIKVAPKDISTSASPIIFYFNKEIDQQTSKQFEISPYVTGKVVVDGKTVRFLPSESYRSNISYVAILKKVIKKDSSDALGLQQTSFVPGFVTSDKLTDDDKKYLSKLTDPQDSHPVLSKLPHSTLDYKIDYQPVGSGENSIIKYTIALYGVYNRPEQRNSYIAQLNNAKSMALSWLKEQGLDTDKAFIVYSPDPQKIK